MITNYIKVSLRNLLKYRQSNFLNIAGLAFGLACCILCYLHIQFELGYDQFNTNYNSIYRLVAGNPAEEKFWAKVAAPMPATFKDQIPEIEDYVRLTSVSYNPKVLIEQDNRTFLEPYFMMGDPSLFNIFTLKTIKGDAFKALQDLNTVVITQSISEKLFGSTDVLGKIIRLKDNEIDFQVGAVVADVPAQSHFRFEYLISFENLDRILGEGHSNSWNAYNYSAYVLLNESANDKQVESKIQAVKLTLPDSKELTFESIFLQPLEKIHFQYNRGNQFPSYDKKYIYVFMTIALSLLAIACINYINLSIALSIKRIKEIGVRKAMGANRTQLVMQFINEGIVSSFLSLIAGLVLLEGSIPFINNYFGSSLATNYFDLQFLGFIFGTTLIVGLVSGSYLAIYVSGYQASSILKGDVRSERKGFGIQKLLVFVQFSISVILIVSSLIIGNQMNFLQKKNLGFNHSQILTVPLSSSITPSQVEELKNQIKQSALVEDVAASSFIPGTANWNQTVWWEGQTEPLSMFIISVDKDFLRTMQIDLIDGDMKQIAESMETQYILNRSAVDLIGWDVPIGRAFSPFGQGRKQTVTAVIENFNYMSLHHAVAPLVLVISDDFALNQLAIRISDANLKEAVAQVESGYKTVLGDIPFEYSFMDDNINRLYESEIRLGRVVSSLTIVAVLFALFGVYGLISFSIENKTKEIAIRKVLGVAPKELLIMFSKTYFQLMLIAFVVCIPVIWSVMTNWLSNFSYRVEINPLWFAISFVAVMVPISVIGFIKYLSTRDINPAQALKND